MVLVLTVLLEAVEYPSWELLAPRVSERRVLPTSGVPTWLLTLRYCTLPPLIMAAFLVHFCWVWSPLCTKQKSAISIERKILGVAVKTGLEAGALGPDYDALDWASRWRPGKR